VRLLVTRPEHDARRTAAALRPRGHVVVVAPLLRVEPVPDADIGDGPWAAILITSVNAAAAIVRHKRLAELKSLPVLAVGDRSAQTMRAAGFANVISAAGGAADLTRLAAERLKQDQPLLYLCGADRTGDVPGDLAARNFVVRTAIVYRAVAIEALPRAATDALAQGIDGVLHFSRRSAATYVNAARSAGLADAALKKPAHFCLSAQVAEPLAQVGAARIEIAPRPEEAALIELISPP
jgi:uroporphyrinogen-III synthase